MAVSPDLLEILRCPADVRNGPDAGMLDLVRDMWLVCRDCGKVEAFSDSRLERAIDRVAGGLGYSVDEHEVVLVGACADCS